MMSCTAEEFVGQAKVFENVIEGSQAHKNLVDIYNSHKPLARGYKLKYNDAWCAAFVSVISIITGMTNEIPTEVGAHEHYKIMKNKGKILSDFKKVSIGDIVYYDWNNDGMVDHVGICTTVNKTTDAITVIEGNNSDAVKYRSILLNNKKIFAIARPDYKTATTTVIVDTEYIKALTIIAKRVIEGKFGNGEQRKEKIYKDVQNRVNELLRN